MKVVLASNNAGKVKEFNELLAPLGFEVLPQSLFGISSCDEPYPTFVENALAKDAHFFDVEGGAIGLGAVGVILAGE